MITVKYPSGKVEQRAFAHISGESPIGSARPIPDGAIMEILDGCLTITAGEDNNNLTIIWPWDKITELELGPRVSETVFLRE